MIIDGHVHLYPAEVAADPPGWARLNGEPGWAECVAPVGRPSIQGWSSLPRLLADMDQAGIGKCVLLGWYWERQETCDLQNRWHSDWIRAHPDRLLAFASVQPAAGMAAVEGLERALDAGLCGVGEILPQAQGFGYDDPWWLQIVEIAAARGVPMTLHVTDPRAPRAAGPPTPFENYLRLAAGFPRGHFILAHWGGGLAFREPTPGDPPLPPNLFFDTAASPLLYDRTIFRRAVDRVGADRIIYGTDYPLRLYPRASREPDFRRLLGDISESGLTPPELKKILGGNIRALLPA